MKSPPNKPPYLRVAKPGEMAPPPPEPGSAYAPLPMLPVHTGHCDHALTSVDANARKVTCRTCKAELDPIAVLDKLAREWDRHRWARGEHAKLRREIEAMKIDVRNLKAQKRRAQ